MLRPLTTAATLALVLLLAGLLAPRTALALDADDESLLRSHVNQRLRHAAAQGDLASDVVEPTSCGVPGCSERSWCGSDAPGEPLNCELDSTKACKCIPKYENAYRCTYDFQCKSNRCALWTCIRRFSTGTGGSL